MERLQDNQQVKRYVEQLQGHDRMVEARECQYLMEQIDHLEWQLEMMGKELKNLRRQLGKADEGSCPTDGKRGERGQRVYSGNKAEHRFGNEKGGQEC